MSSEAPGTWRTSKQHRCMTPGAASFVLFFGCGRGSIMLRYLSVAHLLSSVALCRIGSALMRRRLTGADGMRR
jgi:hypothetical protein